MTVSTGVPWNPDYPSPRWNWPAWLLDQMFFSMTEDGYTDSEMIKILDYVQASGQNIRVRGVAGTWNPRQLKFINIPEQFKKPEQEDACGR